MQLRLKTRRESCSFVLLGGSGRLSSQQATRKPERLRRRERQSTFSIKRGLTSRFRRLAACPSNGTRICRILSSVCARLASLNNLDRDDARSAAPPLPRVGIWPDLSYREGD